MLSRVVRHRKGERHHLIVELASTEHAMDCLVRNRGDAVAELVADGIIPSPRSAEATNDVMR